MTPNQNAFPYTMVDRGEFQAFPGLSRREYFAALAMQGLLASETIGYGFASAEPLARKAIAAADALLAELDTL